MAANNKNSKFCVINHTTPNAHGRTFKRTEAEAVDYAKSLIRNDMGRTNNMTLFVVEIKKIVTTSERPITVHSIKDWEL